MIPAAFDYYRPDSLEEAAALLQSHGDDAKLLAGAHSLLPAMKLRLAQPKVLIDLSRLSELKGISREDGHIRIGSMTTHRQIEESDLLRQHCPLLPEVAPHIGDVQVRNRGTLGGSAAHADPAADWPAALLALEAEFDAVGPNGSRRIAAADFFIDLFQTALQPREILQAIRVPATGPAVAYEKFVQRASGFAIAGVAVSLEPKGQARIGVTGAAAKPFRAAAAEEILRGNWSAAALDQAAARVMDGIDPLQDIHASGEFRVRLAQVQAQRALQRAWARAA